MTLREAGRRIMRRFFMDTPAEILDKAEQDELDTLGLELALGKQAWMATSPAAWCRRWKR